jgi:hypothetical protein
MWTLVHAESTRRPWWMNLMFGLCVYMTFVRLPVDLSIIWNYHDPRGNAGLGAVLGAVFLLPTFALWRSRSSFDRPA